MDDQSKKEMNQYYSNLLDIHGPKREALGIGFETDDQQREKFNLVRETLSIDAHDSILDVGCGLGYFCEYFRQLGWKGHYTGIDINENMIQAAKLRLPDEDFVCADISKNHSLKDHDHVCCIATLQHRPKYAEPWDYLKEMINAMFKHTQKSLIFDLFTTKVDFMKDDNLYADPLRVLEHCYTLTNRLMLRNDYRPFQYMMSLYKDNLKNEKNTFLK